MTMKNTDLQDICESILINNEYLWRSEELLYEKTLWIANNCPKVVDVGKSSRSNYNLFSDQQITTFDINAFEDYPDYLVDICNHRTFPSKKFDAVICHSVLEHTYDPIRAVENLYEILNDRGVFFGFVPFLMKYHAPKSLLFQDYYRFSKDACAYMFKDWDELELYPVRGRISTLFSTVYPIKQIKRSGREIVSKLFDQFTKNSNSIQVTGYYLWARK